MVYTSWRYRARIDVVNPTSILDYQIKVVVPYRVHMKSDFSDIRFSDTNGNELSYWIESKVNSSYANVWFKTSSTPASVWTYYLYYGNAAVSDGGSGNNTFDFFDDFPGTTLDTTKWEGYTAGASISNSIITYMGDTNWRVLSSKLLYNDPAIVEIRGYIPDGSNLASGLGFRDQFGHIAQLLWSSGVIIQHGDGATYPTTTTNYKPNEWHTFKIVWLSNNVHYYQDNVQLTNSPFNTANPQASTSAVGFTSYNSAVQGDWIFTRKYAAIEPTATVFETNINPFHRRLYQPIYIKLYTIDSLFKKLNTDKNYIIDILLKNLNVDKNYVIDILLKNPNVDKNYIIDILLKNSNVDKNYIIDLLFKKLNTDKNYIIDILLKDANIDKNYVIDILLKNPGDKNYVIDTILKGTIDKNYVIDIILKAGNYSIDKNYVIDIILKAGNYSIDCIIARFVTFKPIATGQKDLIKIISKED